MNGLIEQFERSPIHTEILELTMTTGTPTAIATGTVAIMWYGVADANNSGDVFMSVEDDGDPNLVYNAGDITPWHPKTHLGTHYIWGDTAGDKFLVYTRR